MVLVRAISAAAFITLSLSAFGQARIWTDSTGLYSLDAKLIAFDDRTVVLQRDDGELAAFPIDELSEANQEFLKSQDHEATAGAKKELQKWTLIDGSEIVGRLVDYTARDVTLQRRRGRIYVNDRPLDNLPEFYQQLLPKIVAKLENLQRDDLRSLEAWMVRQRGEPRTFDLEGVLLELENGDEYAVPFFMFSEEDQQFFQRQGWNHWQEARRENDYQRLDESSFLLRTLAEARARDKQVQRQIALTQLKLQAVETGLTSIWEVTLYPGANQGGPPIWVVVPGRDSRQAAAMALEHNPNYVVGPVRRVSRR